MIKQMIETGRWFLIISTFAGAFELAALHSAESGDSDGLDGRLGRAIQTAHQNCHQRESQGLLLNITGLSKF